MRRSFLMIALGTAAIAAGCDSGPKLVPASGVVMIDGKPLTSGTVQVAPANGRAAFGTIGPDGRFRLTTKTPGDGVLAGTHPVSVLATEEVNPQVRRWLGPKKYASLETSGLTIAVTDPTDALKLELSWGDEKPFEERYDKE